MLATSCSSDDSEYPAPTSIPAENIRAVEEPGAVRLEWSTPEDANYYYVKVTYTLPEDGKQCTRLASVHSNGLTIDNLLHRYGPIEFTLQTFNRDQSQGGEIHKITARAQAAEKQYVQSGETNPLTIEDKDLFVDTTDNEGNVKGNMLDNDEGTCYQADWSNSPALPRYIVVNLPKSVYAVTFSCSTRRHANNDHPKTIRVYGGTAEFVTGTPFTPMDNGATLLSTVATSFESTSTTTVQNFTSGTIRGTSPFSTLWLEVTETVSGNTYYALSKFSVTELKTNVYDPETGETTPLE